MVLIFLCAEPISWYRCMYVCIRIFEFSWQSFLLRYGLYLWFMHLRHNYQKYRLILISERLSRSFSLTLMVRKQDQASMTSESVELDKLLGRFVKIYALAWHVCLVDFNAICRRIAENFKLIACTKKFREATRCYSDVNNIFFFLCAPI